MKYFLKVLRNYSTFWTRKHIKNMLSLLELVLFVEEFQKIICKLILELQKEES